MWRKVGEGGFKKVKRGYEGERGKGGMRGKGGRGGGVSWL